MERPDGVEFRIVKGGEDFIDAMLYLKDSDVLVVDTETDGLDPYKGNRIMGVSVYCPKFKSAYYFPVRYPEYSISTSEYCVLLDIISLSSVIMFNAKFDLHMLGVDGMKNPPIVLDTMVAAHILNENEHLSNGGEKKGAYTLKRLAKKYLGDWAVEGEQALIDAAKAKGLNPKTEMFRLPAKDVAYYAMVDVVITWYLHEFYIEGLKRWDQVDYYFNRCDFQLNVLLRMERNGMLVSVEQIEKQLAEVEPEMQRLQNEIDAYLYSVNLRFGTDDYRRINLNSTKQLMTMFELMGYPLENTNAETLKLAAAENVPLANAVLQYRQLSKEAGTYYRPYLEQVNKDGIIHHSLITTGAATGRLSSRNPNMQQIPRKGKYKVKKVFVVRPGYALVQWDYRQLELRLAVYYANERKMQAMFNDGVDLHQWTADRLGVSRDLAKTYNFGLLYGMGAKRASRNFSVPLKDAITGVEGWHALYPAFRSAANTYADQAKRWRTTDGKDGGFFQFLRLFNGKIKHYQEYTKYPEEVPPYKDAWNVKIQGTAAAVLELSLTKIVRALPGNDVFRPINQIHDALLAEVKVEYLHEIVPLVSATMTDWEKPAFNPRLEVEAAVSLTSWYDLEVYNKDKDYG